jgi:hypothetical protein
LATNNWTNWRKVCNRRRKKRNFWSKETKNGEKMIFLVEENDFWSKGKWFLVEGDEKREKNYFFVEEKWFFVGRNVIMTVWDWLMIWFWPFETRNEMKKNLLLTSRETWFLSRVRFWSNFGFFLNSKNPGFYAFFWLNGPMECRDKIIWM